MEKTATPVTHVRDAAPTAVGDRVYGGQTRDDYDEGRVIAIVGDHVTVAWDSLVQTTQAASLLRAIH